MSHVIKIPDHRIFAVNRDKRENFSDSIVYKDLSGEFHTINLETCAENFLKEHKESSGKCVGYRDITQKYFVFYTSGVKTMICFKKLYIFNISGRNLLIGKRNSRFMQFEKLLSQTKYTTFDLS